MRSNYIFWGFNTVILNPCVRKGFHICWSIKKKSLFERPTERQTVSMYWLSPTTTSNWKNRARMKPGARNSIHVCCKGQCPKHLRLHLLPLSMHIGRKPQQETELLELESRHSDTGCKQLKPQLKYCTNIAFSFVLNVSFKSKLLQLYGKLLQYYQ